MTAPVDPTPYALPTDLVTAEDVLAWLLGWRSNATDRELIAAVDWVHAYAVQDLRNAHDLAPELAYLALRARLDRERRQACRQGALTAWRFACGQRAIERDWRKATPDEFQSREDLDEWAALAHEDRVTEVRRALAFRAAARAK